MMRAIIFTASSHWHNEYQKYYHYHYTAVLLTTMDWCMRTQVLRHCNPLTDFEFHEFVPHVAWPRPLL